LLKAITSIKNGEIEDTHQWLRVVNKF